MTLFPDNSGPTAPITLEDVRAFLAGRATPEVREKVKIAIEDPTSELRQLLDGVRKATQAHLGWDANDEFEQPK